MGILWSQAALAPGAGVAGFFGGVTAAVGFGAGFDTEGVGVAAGVAADAAGADEPLGPALGFVPAAPAPSAP
ncbi:hypothetical protein ACFWBF_02380 [Streptomyces sp. NPDC060028]|uniref:hypothetical protein n=1 Tax=Streptomyces sp. NPDC060028 TaxID=3347041 RepID=UPI003691F927